ncbi:MAG: adenine deaminase [Firmicutes bacterium]|nr:adenine deaminase [Bacillota bacterium]
MKSLITAAAGRKKAELVFKNINIVNVFTGEILKADVALHNGYIAGIGSYEGIKELYMEGKYLCPGFIDAHIHLESALVTPGEFARGIVARGTTGVIADPHEIANVKGLAGIEYMLAATLDLPLDVYLMLPSCVPATPFENSGSILEAKDLAKLIDHRRVLGLGELMDFESVVAAKDSIIAKIALCQTAGKLIDGHAPGLSGKKLNAYLASGVRTDHECVTPEEAIEKLRLGMYILLREGSAAKNLVDLLPAMNDISRNRCMFCTDDRHPEDILKEGHIDNNIRLAIKNGLDPVVAIQMATINVANCYKLEHVGGIAPGYIADVLVLDDLENVEIAQVYKRGRLVAEKGKALFETALPDDSAMRQSLNFKKLSKKSFTLNIDDNPVRIMGLVPHSFLTKTIIERVYTRDGKYYTQEGKALLKIAVIERHKATGNIGLGLVAGLGLKDGAVASSVAHDSHNIIVVGDNDKYMHIAVEKLQAIEGGVVLVSQGAVVNFVSLPIAGLMSDRPLDEVKERLGDLIAAAHKMGVPNHFDPFMTLSFLALPVIPELKITDLGLFDVNEFKHVDIIDYPQDSYFPNK